MRGRTRGFTEVSSQERKNSETVGERLEGSRPFCSSARAAASLALTSFDVFPYTYFRRVPVKMLAHHCPSDLRLCGPPKTGPFSVRAREKVRGPVEGNGSS